MGGTSMWFTCLALGIVLSVSRSLAPADPVATSPRARTTNTHDVAVA